MLSSSIPQLGVLFSLLSIPALKAVCVCAQLLSHVRLSATSRTAARQAPLSMGFSRQEYWSGLPFPPPGDLPNPGIKPVFPATPALAGGFFYHWASWGAPSIKAAAAAAAKSLQSCPALCNPIDGSPPGSAVPGILQARTSANVWGLIIKEVSQEWGGWRVEFISGLAWA